MRQYIDFEKSVLKEYSVLRSEITARIMIMYQVFSFTLLADGAILTVGFSGNVNNIGLILIYPYISCFAAIIYLSNISVIHNVGKYIKEVIEPLMSSQYEHWEDRLQERATYGYHTYYILASFTIFILTPLLALIAYIRSIPSYRSNPFFYLAVIILFIVLVVMLHNFQMIHPNWRMHVIRRYNQLWGKGRD